APHLPGLGHQRLRPADDRIPLCLMACSRLSCGQFLSGLEFLGLDAQFFCVAFLLLLARTLEKLGASLQPFAESSTPSQSHSIQKPLTAPEPRFVGPAFLPLATLAFEGVSFLESCALVLQPAG